MTAPRKASSFLPKAVVVLVVPLFFAASPATAGADADRRAQDAGDHADSVHNIGAGPAAKDMDLDAWCKAKNSDVGPAVSQRLTDLGAWGYDPKLVVTEPIPHVTAGVPAFVATGVLSDKECSELIAAFPEGGAGYMTGARVAELYRDRQVKSRVLAHDEELARVLFERLKDYMPQELDGGRIYRVNPAFRFVHYETGGHHSTHIDGREPGAAVYSPEAGGWIQSRLTLQVYLNSDYEGGQFIIVEPEPHANGSSNVKHIIQPQKGSAVVFYQERLTPPSVYPPYELQHEGADVTRGEKFAARTMVDFVFPSKERAQLGNVRDDTFRRQVAESLSSPCEEHGRHRVLAIGNTILDTILTVPYIPVDDKLRVQSKRRYVGGQGANAAQAMALLGLSVSFLTRVGEDADGEMAMRHYYDLGMDASAFIVVPNATTSSASVAVSTGDDKHRICLIHDDERLHGEQLISQAVVTELVARVLAKEFSAVYSDGWQMDLVLPIVQAAAKVGIPIVADAEEVTQDTRTLADLATVLIANTPIILELGGCGGQVSCGGVGQVVMKLAEQHGGRMVVATDGPNGSYGVDGRRAPSVLHVPALVADVRDTTGAGDTFHAGFVDGLVRGLSFHDTMLFATQVAAAKCETQGPAVTRESLLRGALLRREC